MTSLTYLVGILLYFLLSQSYLRQEWLVLIEGSRNLAALLTQIQLLENWLCLQPNKGSRMHLVDEIYRFPAKSIVRCVKQLKKKYNPINSQYKYRILERTWIVDKGKGLLLTTTSISPILLDFKSTFLLVRFL